MIPIYRPYLPSSSLDYAHEALNSTWISSQGKYITMVAERLQQLLKVKYVLPVNNGTSACHLLAKCAADKRGLHDVIVPNNVYAAAWNAFLFDGNWNLFSVECDVGTWNYDLDALDAAIKVHHRPCVVLIVHNVGNIMNVPELKIKYPDVTFIEDNCEGFLGTYNGLQSGTESYVSAISFFGNKNITSGEGGAFVTNDEEAYLYSKCIFSQGQSNKRFVHSELGYNYRMTNIQAAILYGQLEILPDIWRMKQKVFDTYRNRLAGREDVLMQTLAPNTEHGNWMFGIRVPDNQGYEQTEAFFKNRNVEIRPMFYPMDAHQYLRDQEWIHIGDCTNAKLLNKECFILPSYPDLTPEEQLHILATLEEYLRNK